MEESAAVSDSPDPLYAEVEALRASRKRLVVAADADRRGIERELHDGVQQELVALVVKMQLAQRLAETEPAAAAKLLDEVRQEAQAVLDSTRKLALHVYPPLLDALGLRAALRSVATDIAPAAAIDVVLDGNCPEELAAAAYFCCVDLMKRLTGIEAIQVHQDADGLVFGLVTRESLGDISSAADRVDALGGRLELVAEPNAAVRVTCSLPLK
jgi:signal transduction histidine kinase